MYQVQGSLCSNISKSWQLPDLEASQLKFLHPGQHHPVILSAIPVPKGFTSPSQACQPILSGPSRWGAARETCVEYSVVLWDTCSASRCTPLGALRDGRGEGTCSRCLQPGASCALPIPLSTALQQQLNSVCSLPDTCRPSFTTECPPQTQHHASVPSLQNSASQTCQALTRSWAAQFPP